MRLSLSLQVIAEVPKHKLVIVFLLCVTANSISLGKLAECFGACGLCCAVEKIMLTFMDAAGA